jgi:NAD(P)-dependent dehydrogenase (short-subunit alcohol dehydrogenase family)
MAIADVQGKVAVVTGGASGVGSGLCRSFAAAGMDVVVADVDGDGAEALASELRGGGRRALAIQVDVASRESVEALAASAFDELGAVHLLCNNAGVIVGGSLLEATDDDWQWMLSVNVMGVVHGCQAFVPRLLAQGQPAHIVNTASVGGFLAGPGLGVYCATKFAVVAISDSLRLELADTPVGVSALCPGGVRTNLIEADRNRPAALSRSGGRAEQLRGAIAAGMDPAEVGAHVLRGIARDAPYIFTHGDYRPAFEHRSQAILSQFDA